MWSAFSTLSIFLVALIGPGPDFSIVMKNSLADGRKAGILSALGIGTGSLIHSSYCILGLGFLLQKDSPAIFWIRLLGCVYLVYLGFKCLFAKASQPKIQRKKVKTKRSWYFEGLITNLLNANAVMFLISIFSTLISQNSITTVCLIGLTMVVCAVAWFSFVSVLFSLHIMNKTFLENADLINRALGILLIAFGVRILFL